MLWIGFAHFLLPRRFSECVFINNFILFFSTYVMRLYVLFVAEKEIKEPVVHLRDHPANGLKMQVNILIRLKSGFT